MSALGQTQTWRHVRVESASPPTADISWRDWRGRSVPKYEARSPRSFLACGPRLGQLQKLSRLNFEHGGELADDLKSGIARALFELAHVRSVHVRFMCESFLRKPPRVAESAEGAGKDLA